VTVLGCEGSGTCRNRRQARLRGRHRAGFQACLHYTYL